MERARSIKSTINVRKSHGRTASDMSGSASTSGSRRASDTERGLEHEREDDGPALSNRMGTGYAFE